MSAEDGLEVCCWRDAWKLATEKEGSAGRCGDVGDDDEAWYCLRGRLEGPKQGRESVVELSIDRGSSARRTAPENMVEAWDEEEKIKKRPTAQRGMVGGEGEEERILWFERRYQTEFVVVREEDHSVIIAIFR